jgi:hypothetical protein
MGLSRRQFFKISAGAVAATMADSVMTGAAPWSKLIRENPGSDGHRRFTLMQDERRAASSETARTQRGTTFNPLQERGIPIDKQFRNWAECEAVSGTATDRRELT